MMTNLHPSKQTTVANFQGFLVGGWTNPIEKYARQKWEGIFPKFRGEHSKKYLSCHHLGIIWETMFLKSWAVPAQRDGFLCQWWTEEL